jgi:glycerophosphoryl diester phosphodiesterase
MNIFETAKEKIIIAAHRGVAAGNIPCNTLPAYKTALLQGADMIEIDVDMSADGTLFIFHPGMERAHLGKDCHIGRMTTEQISELRYTNYDRIPTQFPLNTLDEIFEEFKDKCFINVDKFWSNPERIYNSIKRHGVTDQIIVKSSPSEKVFAMLRDLAPELAFMPVVTGAHPLHERLLSEGINYVGAEVLFSSDDDEVASPEFIARMHADGKLVWVNSIIYDVRAQIAATHSDDAAICGDADFGWGWHVKRGFDIIQTDWTSALSEYLAKNGLLYRKM